MLLTYNEYNRDLGYVQGMSDLLAPIYAVMQDDAVAFWGFVGFMQRMVPSPVLDRHPNVLTPQQERNFLRDQSGMRAQLLTLDHLVQLMDPKLYLHLQSADSTNFFFFFRMLLVWYKREFEWVDVLRLWETLWTDWLSSGFHLFIALAILEKHRDVILEHLKHFDEVLKYSACSLLYPSSPVTGIRTKYPTVNELSNTIDLPSTLVRAETLFRRFQRSVEAIDKKQNFPAPTVRQRKPVETEPGKQNAATTGADAGPSTGKAVAQGIGAEKEKVISPELRMLLSRKVVVLEKAAVVESGGGVN